MRSVHVLMRGLAAAGIVAALGCSQSPDAARIAEKSPGVKIGQIVPPPPTRTGAVQSPAEKPAPPAVAPAMPAPPSKDAAKSAPTVKPEPANLMKSGSFESWNYPTLPYPWVHGMYYTSKEPCPSKLTRSEDLVSDGKFAACQQWRASDAMRTVSHTFYQRIPDLKPNSTYTLQFAALSKAKDSALITVWSHETVGDPPADPVATVSRDDKFTPLVRVEVAPSEDFRHYQATFTTDEHTAIVVSSAYGGHMPAQIVWDDFRLIEGAAPAKSE